jgi:hypothetical protein
LFITGQGVAPLRNRLDQNRRSRVQAHYDIDQPARRKCISPQSRFPLKVSIRVPVPGK